MFRRQKHFGAAAPVEPAFNNSHNNKNYILVVKHNFSINNNVQPFIGGNRALQKRSFTFPKSSCQTSCKIEVYIQEDRVEMEGESLLTVNLLTSVRWGRGCQSQRLQQLADIWLHLLLGAGGTAGCS